MVLDRSWPGRPDFLRLWAAQSISQFGTMLFLLPLVAITALDASPLEVGVLGALQALPALAFGMLLGAWIDRTPRRRWLIGADLGRAGALALIPIAAWLDFLTLPLLYGVALTVGTLTVGFDVAQQAYVPALVDRSRLSDANGKLASTEYIAEIGAPAIGGGLVAAITAPAAVVVDAISYLVSGAFVATIRSPEAPPPAAGNSSRILSEVREGIALVLAEARLLLLVAVPAMWGVFGGFFGALYAIFAIRTLDLSPAALGVLIGAGGIGALGGALGFDRLVRRVGYGAVVAGGFVGSGIVTLAVPFAGGPAVVAFGMLFAIQIAGDAMLGNGFIAARSFRQTITPDAILGRVNAADRSLSGLGSTCGLLAGGIAGEVLGVRTGMAIGAAGMLAVALLFLTLPRHETPIPEAGRR